MNLQPINPPLKPGQTVACCACNEAIKHTEPGFADLDGDSFKSYYHGRCKPLNEYEQAQEDRRDRYKARAEKATNTSDAAVSGAMESLSVIPPGQPILIGHHSEKRHRAHLRRGEGMMARGRRECRRAVRFHATRRRRPCRIWGRRFCRATWCWSRALGRWPWNG